MANREKRSIKALWQIGWGLFFFALALPCASGANEPPAGGVSLEKLGDCNWQVTYRGRIYDLSPLTRESLSRPVENDVRLALQRVPEAAERLRRMDRRQKEARIHTFFASAFISGVLITQLWKSRDTNEKNAKHYRALSWGFGGMFALETLFSFLSTRAAKRELVGAVEEFNAHSPYPMEPAMGSAAEPGKP